MAKMGLEFEGDSGWWSSASRDRVSSLDFNEVVLGAFTGLNAGPTSKVPHGL